MHLISTSTIASTLACALLCLADAIQSPTPLSPWGGCVPYGPLVPRPTDLGKAKIIQDATAKLSQTFDDALAGKIKAGFDVNETSFSVGFVSRQGEGATRANSGLIWSYHHLGKNNSNGTKIADENSQYLIGSVSKLFTDVLLLKSNINLDDSIIKYLPTLQGTQSLIQWDNITLSALSNHLAGIPSNLRKSVYIISVALADFNHISLIVRLLFSTFNLRAARVPCY
jgi:CubicO group peptidase (beta-lactamase class C family)